MTEGISIRKDLDVFIHERKPDLFVTVCSL